MVKAVRLEGFRQNQSGGNGNQMFRKLNDTSSFKYFKALHPNVYKYMPYLQIPIWGLQNTGKRWHYRLENDAHGEVVVKAELGQWLRESSHGVLGSVQNQKRQHPAEAAIDDPSKLMRNQPGKARALKFSISDTQHGIGFRTLSQRLAYCSPLCLLITLHMG